MTNDLLIKKKRKPNSTVFKKGDPRINRNGGPTVPVRIDEIKNEIKHLFIEFFHKYYHSNYEECVRQLNSKQLTVGESIAARFLISACNPNNLNNVAHVTFIARLVGIKLDPDTQVNIQNNLNITLEDMVTEANKPLEIEQSKPKQITKDDIIEVTPIVQREKEKA